jgi:hypothetical protein
LYDEAYGYDPDVSLKPKSRGPLGDAIVLDQTFDDAFMDANVDRFVERVAVNVQKPRLDVEALRDRFVSGARAPFFQQMAGDGTLSR